MICFMFPGQPMARTDLPRGDREFEELAELCFDCSGFNPLELDTAHTDLEESIRLQLYGVAMGLHRYGQLTRQWGMPDLIAEHSMGIYPALAAAGAIGSAQAFELAGRIGCSLAGLGKRYDYALGSVIGLPLEPVQAIADNTGSYVANYNTSRHFLLAGERKRVAHALEEAQAAGAFSVGLFDCDAPLHTPLVTVLSEELRSILTDYCFREPLIPLVDHIDQRLLTAREIPAFLVEELCRPVYWERTYLTLRYNGVERFMEAGSGAALTKFNRWIDSQI